MTPIVPAKYKSVHAKAAKRLLAERREEEVKEAHAYISVPVDLPVETIWCSVGLSLPTEWRERTLQQANTHKQSDNQPVLRRLSDFLWRCFQLAVPLVATDLPQHPQLLHWISQMVHTLPFFPLPLPSLAGEPLFEVARKKKSWSNHEIQQNF